MKLLIVDDSLLIRNRVAEQVLANASVDFIAMAADGDTAVNMYKSHRPDLVILDLHMPGKNGFDVLKQIKQENNKAHVCVLTAYDHPHYREHCHKLGATYFLNKNDDFKQLDNILASEKKHFKQPEKRSRAPDLHGY